MNAIDMQAIAARHPDLVQAPLGQRLRIPLMALVATLYVLFCFWLFSVGKVLATAHWDIAGAYLADWVSFEERPEIRLQPDGTMRVVFPNNSALGNNPQPEWLTKEETVVTRTVAANGTTDLAAKPKSTEPGISFMPEPAPDTAQPNASASETPKTVTDTVVTRARVQFGATSSVDVTPSGAEIRYGDETQVVPMGQEPVVVSGPLPSWASQPYAGKKVIVSLGLSGWLEVDAFRVKIHKRFLGWANFIFDTNSKFFGKSPSEVVTLVVAGPRLDPTRSNAALAVDDFLYNPSWQHLDVWTKLLQTVVMAFVGTLFAVTVAFPLSFIAARNITRNRLTNQIAKRLFDFLRSVDMFIWALFFTRAFGPGPLAGISAIFFTDTGTFGKLYSEALENIDDKPREGVKSVGASPVAVQRYGVLPQVLPVFASQALYFWESNTRSATIIGAVGAGGIGLKLWEAMRTNADWENVAYMVLLILIVVYIFDGLSNALRQRLMASASR
jgi:phosphonate transport system permease protein